MKKKILIIDDEKDFTQLVKMNLELTGKYEVRIENEGTNALNTAKEYKPDLILLDIVLPDMPGEKIAQNLKENPLTRDIPIVFLTALVTKDEISQEKFIAEYPFVSKPVNIDELIEVIEENIKKEST